MLKTVGNSRLNDLPRTYQADTTSGGAGCSARGSEYFSNSVNIFSDDFSLTRILHSASGLLSISDILANIVMWGG